MLYLTTPNAAHAFCSQHYSNYSYVRTNDAVRASTQSESGARFEQLSDKSTQQHIHNYCAELETISLHSGRINAIYKRELKVIQSTHSLSVLPLRCRLRDRAQ